jgi:hypothetical protein
MTGVAIAVSILGHRGPGGIGRVDNDRGAVLSTAMMALLHDLLQLHLGAVARHRVEGPAVDYYGLAAAAAASWIGVPGPGEPVLIAAGVLASKGKLDLASVVVVAWAAAMAGGILGWAIGVGSYLAGPAVVDVVDDFGTGTSVIVAAAIVAGVGLELARRHRLRSRPGRWGLSQSCVWDQAMLTIGGAGSPISNWMSWWGSSGMSRGSFFHGLPLTNAEIGPLRVPTCFALSG